MAAKKKHMRTIQLLNGNVLECESRRGRKPKKQTDNYAALMLFVRYAWLLYNNRERIYSDSKLFLAKVPIWVVDDGWYFVLDDNVAKRELYKQNCYYQPLQATLGGMLEYWETNEDAIISNGSCNYELVYQFYARRGMAHVIRQDGTSFRREYYGTGFCRNDAHKEIHERYDEAMQTCKAYSLDKVVDVLLRGQGLNRSFQLMVQNEQLKFELRKETDKNSRLLRFYRNIRSKRDQLFEYIAYLRRDEILPYYQKELEFQRNKPKELEQIEEEIRAKEKELLNSYNPNGQQELRELHFKQMEAHWASFHDKEWEEFSGSDIAPSRIMENINKYEQLDEAELKGHLVPRLPDT